MRQSRWMPLGVAVTIFGASNCSRADANDGFAIGRAYRLTLHLTTPTHVLRERAAYFAPIVDSAVLLLRVDSAAHDSVYATFSGELRHFPVVFRSLDDSSVVIGENHGHLTALVSARGTDAGLQLSGIRKHDVVSGSWHSLTESSTDSGTFTVRPGA